MSNQMKPELTDAKRALLERWRKGQTAAEAPIPARGDSGPALLSFTQQRVWFMEQLAPDSAAYNMPTALRLSGPLHREALVRSLTRIVARHSSLRTRFLPGKDGEPVQMIGPAPARFPLCEEDLTHLPEPKRWPAAELSFAAEALRPFDLTADLLLRCRLLKLGDEEHLFIFTLHHIAADGWSGGIFMSELSRLYEAGLVGREADLAPLSVEYIDYARWQRERLQGAAMERQLRYWTRQLSGSLPVLELPADRPRPALPSYRGAHRQRDLPKALSDGLKALGRQEGASLFMILLAAFNTLLHRYSRQEDLIIGTTVANRGRTEVEQLIGFFANTLVLRTDMSGNPTFRELIRRAKEVALGAFEYQEMPFERLVEVLQPDRNLSHSPIFQVMFILHNTPMEPPALAGMTAHQVFLREGTAKVDLWLSLAERPTGLLANMEYSTDLFEAETIDRMLAHFETLLAQIVANPDSRIADLDLLPPGERHLVLEAFNQTDAPYPNAASIHALIEAQAERTPLRPALRFAGESLSYAELNRRANRLAHWLRSRGVGPDDLVGICMERSEAMVIAMLATLKAGGAYVPLDPAYPAERIAFMQADAGLKLLLTDPLPDLAGYPETNPEAASGPDNLAYVIYTSGSTGKPKGVQLEHRSVVNFLNAMAREPGITADDVLVAVTSISFDIAGLELWLPLTQGAQVVLASREAAADGAALASLLQRSGATVLQATPATWRLLLEAGWEPGPALKMLVGGEALPRELANRLSAGGELWNLYGPTETTIWSTCCRVSPGEGPVTIGRPIANTQIYILDAGLRPAPVGVPGELYIGGDGLARGYLNRPELTAERFVASPLKPGARIYRTGDLARWLPDGTIGFLGRVDHQVKIRGFRIELGEIETALGAHTQVKQAVVVAREEGAGEKRLVAYLVPDPAQPPTALELRAFLKESLPDYMIPTAFVALEAMPLTPNGKVDRKALPAPEAGALVSGEAYVAPRGPIEAALARIWAEVLGLERVGIHDSFFALGGHSLLGIRLLSRVRETFSVNLPLRVLFETPTIAELALAVGGAEVAPALQEESLPVITPDPAHGAQPFPLTYVQEAFILGRSGYFDLGACGTNFYNEFEVTGATAGFPDRLNRAVQRLVSQHAVLRSRILPDGRQAILPAVPPYRAQVADLRGRPAEQVEAELAAIRLRMNEGKAPVDRWPLFEFRAALLDGDRIIVQCRIDTLILDGVSRLILLKDLFQLLEEPEAELEPYACTYRDYALGLMKIRETEMYYRARDYWLKRLPELPPGPELPLAGPVGPATRSRVVSHVAKLLDPEAWDGLKSRAGKMGLTPSAAAIAAFADVMARWSRGPRFTFSVIASYRLPMHDDIFRMVGNFNSISLLGVDMAGSSFAERARRVQSQLTQDLEHLYYSGFEALREWNRLRGMNGRASSPVLFNSLVEYNHARYRSRNLDRGAASTPDGELRAAGGGFTIPNILLEPILHETADGALYGQWLAVDDAFPPGMVAAMLEAYGEALRRLAGEPGSWDAEASLAAKAGPATAPCWLSFEPAAPGEAQDAGYEPWLESMADLWEGVLGVRPTSPADDFYALGGDSLKAVRLLARIEEQFACKPPVTALAGGTTLAYFAHMLNEALMGPSAGREG